MVGGEPCRAQSRWVSGATVLPRAAVLASLRGPLDPHLPENVVPGVRRSGHEGGLMITGLPPKFHGTRDNLRGHSKGG